MYVKKNSMYKLKRHFMDW